MNLLQPINSIRTKLNHINTLSSIEKDLAAWFLVKYNELKQFRKVVEVSLSDVRSYAYKIAQNKDIDYEKIINNALKELMLMYNFERPLIDERTLYLKRK